MRSIFATSPAAPASPAERAAWKKRRIQYTLLLGLVLALLVFCGYKPVSLRTLSRAPASAIRLSIAITGQYATPYTAASEVTALVTFSDASGSFALSGKQSFACNGTSFPVSTYIFTYKTQLPRQPPGGAYSCVYTDDQGQQTALTLNVPQGALAITSPASGATVAIPGNPPTSPPDPSCPIFIVTPTVTPNPLYTPTDTPGPIQVSPTVPPAVRVPQASSRSLLISYTLPTLPPGAQAIVSGEAVSFCSNGMQYGTVSGPQERATGSYTLADTSSSSGQGFGLFVPGHGTIVLRAAFSWSPAAGGLSAATVSFRDMLAEYITWVAPQA
jgi:hypothetical protein